ncbi:hypothetical protein QBC43DRAFT_356196 [Cladorrhinum sp. PSN259]|nr:hypothetical protein QBC43DRAFT_356196 [Cladorrhinum sp. PSN259]
MDFTLLHSYAVCQNPYFEFERMWGPNGPPHHNEALRAIDMLCEDEAAAFFDSSLELKDIIELADESAATPEDYQTVKNALKQRFPARMTDEAVITPASVEFRDLKQNAGETLQSSYSRTRSIHQRLSFRDLPKDANAARANPLSPMEKTFLTNVIEKFVRGLYKKIAFHVQWALVKLLLAMTG